MGRKGNVRLSAVVFLIACVAAIMSGCSTDQVSAKPGVIITPGYTAGNDSIKRGEGSSRDDCSGSALLYNGPRDDKKLGVVRNGDALTFDLSSSPFKVQALIVGEKLEDYTSADADPQVTAQLSSGQIAQLERTQHVTIRTEDFQPFITKIDWVTFCGN